MEQPLPQPGARHSWTDYAPLPGVADELFGPDGDLRPVWRGFIDYLGRRSEDRIVRQFARGDQYLRDAGVFFRQNSRDRLDRARLAAEPYPGADRREPNGAS